LPNGNRAARSCAILDLDLDQEHAESVDPSILEREMRGEKDKAHSRILYKHARANYGFGHQGVK